MLKSGDPNPYVINDEISNVLFSNEDFELNNIDQVVADTEAAAGAPFCKWSILAKISSPLSSVNLQNKQSGLTLDLTCEEKIPLL